MGKRDRRRAGAGRARHGRSRNDEAERAEPRSEAEILAELRLLCHEPGFAHIVAHVTVRDNFVFYREEMKPEDMAHMFGAKRLIRTEVATMIGYMVQAGPQTFDQLPTDPVALLAKAEAI